MGLLDFISTPCFLSQIIQLYQGQVTESPHPPMPVCAILAMGQTGSAMVCSPEHFNYPALAYLPPLEAQLPPQSEACGSRCGGEGTALLCSPPALGVSCGPRKANLTPSLSLG